MLPVYFLGHGSPMNAIETNKFTQGWQQQLAGIQPKAILMISAHWDTDGLRILNVAKPKTIHDFGGFPAELFAVQYPAPGAPELAATLLTLLEPFGATLNSSWGLDHGSWSLLKHLFPKADIPVVQLSVNSRQSPAWHFQIGQQLQQLRQQGVLIIGSGNIVHNLRRLAWEGGPVPAWASQFLLDVKTSIDTQNWPTLFGYTQWGAHAQMAVPHPDHLLPLFVVAGASHTEDSVRYFNDEFCYGSLAMTSLQWG